MHRAVRAGVLMPLVFSVGIVVGNQQMALFGAFGSFALLALTDVSGPRRVRLTAFATVAVAGALLVVLGTLCARQVALATVSMAVVAFVVLLAGAMSPSTAMTTTAALLAFILPVSIPAPGADLGARLAGWWLAVAVAVPAQLFIWPPHWHDRLREDMAQASDAVRRVLGLRLAGGASSPGQADAFDQARTQVAAVQLQFESTPFRPTTSVGRGLALAKVVDDLEWLRAASTTDPDRRAVDPACCPDRTRQVWLAADAVLAQVPALLETSVERAAPDDPAVVAVASAVRGLQSARQALSDEIRQWFGRVARPAPPDPPPSSELVAAVGASLNARRVANATELIGRHVLLAAGLSADEVPAGRALTVTPATELESFATVRSVWLRTAVRGAVGLALAVAVAKSFPIQHGFWVVLGTLSVLRSNAVGTGSRALRAFGGTVVGFAAAAVVLDVIGAHEALLWIALPLTVVLATLAPTVVSFVVGQAAFTGMVVVLFNLLAPDGWHVGLIRVQDVAIGCAISVVVGFLCWPRGASGVFGSALGGALSAGSGYLLAAVSAMTGIEPDVDLHRAHVAALGADRRLDDAFRLLLTERSARRVGLDVTNRLVAGATRVRLAAFSLLTLPEGTPVEAERLPDPIAAAGRSLCQVARASHEWYQQATHVLGSGRGRLTEPPPRPEHLRGDVAAALDEARRQGRPDLVDHTLRLIWVERHLQRQSELQHDLAHQAEHLLALRRAWWG